MNWQRGGSGRRVKKEERGGELGMNQQGRAVEGEKEVGDLLMGQKC